MYFFKFKQYFISQTKKDKTAGVSLKMSSPGVSRVSMIQFINI